MREILFRGQRIDNGEWVYGSYVSYEKTLGIIEKENTEYTCDGGALEFFYTEVRFDTVSQFTGLLDKNGNKIFEGKNSLKLHIIGLGRGIVDVLMKDGQWQIYSESQGYAPLFEMLNNSAIELEIIGNIHEENK